MPPPLMSVLVQRKKGPIPPPLPLESPPAKPLPPVTAAASSPSTTPKKRQRSSSIDSSGDEVPKHKNKDKPRHHTGENICRVDEGALDRLHKVQPQLLKDLRVLHNFKEVNGHNVEDPKNSPMHGSPQSFGRAEGRKVS